MKDRPAVLLIVDDLTANLQIMQQVLAEHLPSCRVLTAVNAEEALEKAAAQPIDGALIDVQLPGTNGIELCRLLHAKSSGLHFPVILLTAHSAGADLKARGLEAGADDFITRPVDNLELIARVKVMLRIKEADDELRAVNARLEDLVEERTQALVASIRSSYDLVKAVPIGILTFRFQPPSRFLIEGVNPESCRLLGKTEEELRGKEIDRVITGLSSRQSKDFVKMMADQAVPHFLDFEVMSKDGASYHKGRVFRLGRSRLSVVLEDVTSLKIAEQELQKSERRLVQAQKLEAIGTLAGGIAHDFNNLLAAILTYGQFAHDELPEESASRADLQEVLKAGNRAKDLVKQILSFSRQMEGKRSHFSAHTVVEEAIKLLRGSIPSSIEIKHWIEKDSGIIYADPVQINQIVMNLGTNSYYALRDGTGTLSIELHRVGETRPELLPAHGEYLRLTVEDTGPGMDAATQERIFDPFFTTKPVGEGTGLGLSTVYGIVESLQGLIDFESEPGEGTSFRIYLPLSESDHAGAALEQQDAVGGNERILVVDDEEVVARALARSLTRMGYQVTTCLDGQEALDCIIESEPAFQMVITDLAMPKVNGAQLVHRIRQYKPGLPVILLTGFAERLSTAGVQALGFADFLIKPIEGRDLDKSIRKVFDAN